MNRSTDSKTDRPVVAHLRKAFFHASETFIYNAVSNLKRYRPICLARQAVNRDTFAFPGDDLYVITPAETAWSRFYQGLRRQLTGLDPAEKIMKARKARLIHAHFGWQGYKALGARKRLNIPLVTTFYGYDLSGIVRKRPRWRKRYGRLFRKGDLFLVEGPHMREKLIQLGCPEGKVRIQRIAIPVGDIPFLARKPKGKDEKVIFIFCGRFVEKKGLLQTLQAFRDLRETRGRFEFRIIGDGILRDEIEAYIKTHHLTGHVSMLGFLTYRDYLRALEKADIFVHPSITGMDGDSEGGAPTTILEAQAAGLPVISTYHADIPNVVVPDRSALLSEERDVAGLKSSLARMMDHQDAWRDMGREGRAFVERHHSLDGEIPRLEEAYDRLLGGRRP
jgi:colanic acid/amylovoran biosynthesis glycosyltransferase